MSDVMAASVGGLNQGDHNKLVKEEIDKYARFAPQDLGWKGAKKRPNLLGSRFRLPKVKI
jgi:hypothetical protein